MVDESVESNKPVVVTVTSTSAQGAGAGLVQTPMGQPNIFIKVISPFKVVAVRAARTFLQVLLGTLGVGATAPSALGAQDFYHALLHGASVSVAATVICVIQNLIELSNNFDQSHPTLTS